MPVASHKPAALATIDANRNTQNFDLDYYVGETYTGNSKSQRQRALLTFDLTAPTLLGRPLNADDAIVAAELVLRVNGLYGAGGWPVDIKRISRADWDYRTVTWNQYKESNNWTATGGDTATPPAAVAYNSPALTGPFTISGLAAFVTDALANRAGKLHMLHVPQNDNPGHDALYIAYGNLADSTSPVLNVTFTTKGGAAIDRPHAHRLSGDPAARPAAGAVKAAPARAARVARPSRPATSR